MVTLATLSRVVLLRNLNLSVFFPPDLAGTRTSDLGSVSTLGMFKNRLPRLSVRTFSSIPNYQLFFGKTKTENQESMETGTTLQLI